MCNFVIIGRLFETVGQLMRVTRRAGNQHKSKKSKFSDALLFLKDLLTHIANPSEWCCNMP